MQFSKVIGKGDEKVLAEAAKKITKVLLELGSKPECSQLDNQLGGDPFIFSLVAISEHVANWNLPALAATDGRRFFWNPAEVVKRSVAGIRIVAFHEAMHASLMHPTRRGKRNPKLWNIAVDYIVNGMAMEDLLFRLKSKDECHNFFVKNLGNYLTLEQCKLWLTDPFNFSKIPGVEKFVPDPTSTEGHIDVELPKATEERELTDKEKEELEKRLNKVSFYFSDPELPQDFRTPEKIYDLLYSLVPKCQTCGNIGKYKKPQNKKDKNQKDDKNSDSSENQKDKSDQENKSNQSGCGNDKCGHCCPDCGDDFDILDLGSMVDEHIDSTETPEKMAKKLADAARFAKHMAGRIPAGIEDEIGVLTAPRIRWTDVIRTKMQKIRTGNSKNDWTRFRSRPLFAGMVVPKRKSVVSTFACLLDTSGSMNQDDIALGISQLQSLDERSEGWIVPADCSIYFDKATKINRCNREELLKTKIVGRGGTMFASFFKDYSKHFKDISFIIVLTDGYLIDSDLIDMQNPGIPVYWVITSDNSSFNPPFGKVFNINN